jgi:mannose-6-phosphate isomerase-like protein (cupin superfamily)
MRRSSWWKVICGSIFGMAVHVSAGEMFVVPKGVEHKPYAEREVKLLLIEPRGVLNTGHEGGERTATNDVWI